MLSLSLSLSPSLYWCQDTHTLRILLSLLIFANLIVFTRLRQGLYTVRAVTLIFK